MNNACMYIIMLYTAFQYDHCKDDMMMWSDTQKFKSAADDKPGLPPDSIVEIFMEVTQKCTQKNHKRRYNMDDVN